MCKTEHIFYLPFVYRQKRNRRDNLFKIVHAYEIFTYSLHLTVYNGFAATAILYGVLCGFSGIALPRAS